MGENLRILIPRVKVNELDWFSLVFLVERMGIRWYHFVEQFGDVEVPRTLSYPHALRLLSQSSDADPKLRRFLTGEDCEKFTPIFQAEYEDADSVTGFVPLWDVVDFVNRKLKERMP